MRWQQEYFVGQRVEALLFGAEGRVWTRAKVVARATQDITVETETTSPQRYAIRKKDEIRPILPTRTS